MNKIALVNNVHVDDWIAKLGIIASSDAEERPTSQPLHRIVNNLQHNHYIELLKI